ncbi:MAG: PAS domain-containing hybrid sensor histidine kinase/response regulator, partial [bacterium]
FTRRLIEKKPEQEHNILQANNQLQSSIILNAFINSQTPPEQNTLPSSYEHSQALQDFNKYADRIIRYFAQVSDAIDELVLDSLEPEIQTIRAQLDHNYYSIKKQNDQTIKTHQILSVFIILYSLFLLYKFFKSTIKVRKLNFELDEYKQALDAHAIVTVSDPTGHITYANNRAVIHSGFNEKELIGQNHRVFNSGFHPPEFFERLWRTINSGKVWHGVLRNKKRDGGFIWLDTTIVPFMNKKGLPEKFVSIRTDISRIRKLEKKQLMLASGLNQVGEAILISDRDAMILYANEAWEELTGYKEHELIGKPMTIFRSGELKEEFYVQALQYVYKGNTWYGELGARRKDGLIIRVERTVSPVLSSEGNVEYLIFLQRDISQRISKLKKREHQNRLQSLGVMAGGIAHDFNNYLASIMGFAALAQTEESENIRNENLQAIEDACENATHLTNQLLVYAGNREQKFQLIALDQVIQDVLKFIRPTEQPIINFEIAPNARPPFTIQGDIRQVEQVIMNLITNAQDAVKNNNHHNASIDIHLCQLNLRQEDLIHFQSSEKSTPGRFLQIVVSDNGSGMDQQTQNQLFDPFFTTKQDGHGLGMGAVLGILRAHSGGIKFKSTPGLGTEFRVIFPQYQASDYELARLKGELKSEKTKESKTPAKDKGKALIIDDVSSLRTIAGQMLLKFGYQPIKAKSGQKGLDILEQTPDIQLILLDLTMPEMSGAETLEHIRAYSPDLPVILMSGFTHNSVQNLEKKHHIQGFLKKPFSLKDLDTLLSSL